METTPFASVVDYFGHDWSDSGKRLIPISFICSVAFLGLMDIAEDLFSRSGNT
ncbi:MAG: hypothetical protein HGA93_01985 [Methanothrix sp.]|nr:hypothetical protein [Methanothrix sp.]